MAVDIFDPREMAEAFEQRKAVPRFLRDSFVTRSRAYDADTVDIDIKIGGIEVAPYVLPAAPATVVDHRGFRVHSYSPPRIFLSGEINEKHLTSRVVGEHIYENISKEDRKRLLAGELLGRFDDMIGLREEIQVAQAAQTGQITVVDQAGNTLETISYRDLLDGSTGWATNQLNVNPVVAWNDATVADRTIYQDLWDWALIVQQACGKNANIGIMGKNVHAALIGDIMATTGKLHGLLDMGRVVAGEIVPADMTEAGVQYVGQIKGLAGLDLYVYTAKDADGNSIVDDDNLIIGSTAATTEMRYGALAKPKDDRSGIEMVSAPRVLWPGIEDNPPREMVYLASKGLFVPVEIGAFLCAQPLTAAP